MATIANLSIKMTLDSQKLTVDLGKVRNQLKNLDFRSPFERMSGRAMDWLKGLPTQLMAAAAAYFTVSRAVQELSASMQRIDRRAKIGDRLGIEFGTVQRMDVVARKTGTDLEVLTKAMLHMNKTVGSGGKPLDKRLADVARGINAIEDPAKRSAKQLEIFGKQGFELSEFIRQADKIDKTNSLIDRFGLAMSRVDASKVERANDALMDLKIVSEGFIDRLTVRLAPSIDSFATRLLSFTDRLNGSLGRVGLTIEDLVVAMMPLVTMIETIDRLEKRSPFFRGAMKAAGFSGPGDVSPGSSIGSGGSDPSFGGGPLRPRALERGSSESISAILAGGGNPIAGVLQQNIAMVGHLRAMRDDLRDLARGEGAVVLRPAGI